jgi:hypothetical protein
VHVALTELLAPPVARGNVTFTRVDVRVEVVGTDRERFRDRLDLLVVRPRLHVRGLRGREVGAASPVTVSGVPSCFAPGLYLAQHVHD